ncbi:hypothetical protein QYF36_014447 [Acer negundo]|nr:hypothetical protein QYF36_014447 [Acer negundo]
MQILFSDHTTSSSCSFLFLFLFFVVMVDPLFRSHHLSFLFFVKQWYKIEAGQTGVDLFLWSPSIVRQASSLSSSATSSKLVGISVVIVKQT